jgi:hypothetical protein
MFREQIERLLLQRPIPVQEIVSLMAKASRLAEPDDFEMLVQIARMDDAMDQSLAYPALALLPAWGDEGLDELCRLAMEGPHYTAAVSVLTTLALGRVPQEQDLHFLREGWNATEKYQLPPAMPDEAQRKLRAIIFDHLGDAHLKSRLLNAISWQSLLFPEDNTSQEERLNFLVDMLIDSHMYLNKTILKQFEDLLAAGPAREEELHKFLVEHPVLLDPFVTELRSKHELGDDFITDFVIRRMNDEYVAVEIENSTDKLFNKDGSLTADLMKAIGQVRDFQAWLGDNIAYAQTKLPHIRRPEGLVVIGRRPDLAPIMEKRLSEENFSRRGHIKVVTFDDLLSQAKAVYQNALDRPLVLRAKEQKTL